LAPKVNTHNTSGHILVQILVLTSLPLLAKYFTGMRTDEYGLKEGPAYNSTPVA
jgi:hypothetical protein